METLQEARRARYYQPWLLLNDHHFQKLDIVINKNSNLVKFNNQAFKNSKNLRQKKIIASMNSEFFFQIYESALKRAQELYNFLVNLSGILNIKCDEN